MPSPWSVVLKFDGTALADAYQPSRCWWDAPKSALDELAGGGVTSTPQDIGGVLHLDWEEATLAAVITALVTARGGVDPHTVSWTEPGKAEQTKNVMWPSDPSAPVMPPYVYGSLHIELAERPA